jgi:hypothetical protein
MVLDPVEVHVNGFGAVLLDSVIGNADSAFVIGLDGHDNLRMLHILKSSAENGTGFAIVEERANFCFAGKRVGFMMKQ